MRNETPSVVDEDDDRGGSSRVWATHRKGGSRWSYWGACILLGGGKEGNNRAPVHQGYKGHALVPVLTEIWRDLGAGRDRAPDVGASWPGGGGSM